MDRSHFYPAATVKHFTGLCASTPLRQDTTDYAEPQELVARDLQITIKSKDSF